MKLITEIDTAIRESVAFLRYSQLTNGQFLGLASKYADDFDHAEGHQTTFFTSLIVECLKSVPGTSQLKNRAVDFILSERSSDWSWNYWLRSCEDYKRRAYPDDLDDTSCALIALTASSKSLLNQDSLANFAKLLISQEVKPGGPYSTWLVNSAAKPVWKDIDIAVNANIGYFLKLHDVKLAGLDEYITSKINRDELNSPYYLTDIPVIYFIARMYNGPANKLLQNKVAGYISNYESLTNIQLSMLISAAYSLNMNTDFKLLIMYLLNNRTGPSWPASAIYYEPAVNGISYFAGSLEISSAFACEALQKYKSHNLESTKSGAASETGRKANKSLKLDTSSFSRGFESKYQIYLNKVVAVDTDGKITRIADITAESTGKPCDSEMLIKLNLASLHGWASYTIFDDLMDGESEPDLLPLAMVSLRRACSYFKQALPNRSDFAAHVEKVIDTVDDANYWEISNCHLNPKIKVINKRDLPEFEDLSQLAHKSWGHTIAGSGVLLSQDYKIGGNVHSSLQNFYYYYLIARQLNDDAHDWQDDLTNHQLSYVVTKLLRNFMDEELIDHIDPVKDIPALQLYFWTHTVTDVIDLIELNVELAGRSIIDCQAISDPSVYLEWLEELTTAISQVAVKRQEARSFIDSFTSN